MNRLDAVMPYYTELRDLVDRCRPETLEAERGLDAAVEKRLRALLDLGPSAQARIHLEAVARLLAEPGRASWRGGHELRMMALTHLFLALMTFPCLSSEQRERWEKNLWEAGDDLAARRHRRAWRVGIGSG